MYFDNETKIIFHGLPEIYQERNISNFYSLNDEELSGLNIFKISGFVQNKNYFVYSFLLGTEYFDSSYFNFELVEDNSKLKVICDEDVIKRLLTPILRRHHRNYVSVQDMIFDYPIQDTKNFIVYEENFQYDFENSYAFILFGQTTLVDRGNDNYTLARISPEKIPTVYNDDLVSQSTGFSGRVVLVVPEKQIVKLVDCKNIELLDRMLPIRIGNTEIDPNDIFRYELYLKPISINGKPWEKTQMIHTCGQTNYNIIQRTLYTTKELKYSKNYAFELINNNRRLFNIDINISYGCEPNIRNYIITDYGRQE